ncbi:MAG: lysophospholipid acyltransferase family protein [Anaerolineales bacterium]|nr:lysophospholipid acyltransferase family protein [Anaerolineales bacterium]
MNHLIERLTTFILKIYLPIACRVDAPDLQQKIPQKGPLIVVINHTGRIEVPLLYAYLRPRLVTAWAKAETWENWFLRGLFTAWGVIPIHRGEADMSALKRALRVLEQGYIFGLAPEGTRNYTGVLRRALPGAVVVALHSGAPIVPIAHWGGENYLKSFFKRTDFHVRVGEMFEIDTKGVKVNAEIRQQIADEMMREIAKLLPEKYRGEYADIDTPAKYLIRKAI